MGFKISLPIMIVFLLHNEIYYLHLFISMLLFFYLRWWNFSYLLLTGESVISKHSPILLVLLLQKDQLFTGVLKISFCKNFENFPGRNMFRVFFSNVSGLQGENILKECKHRYFWGKQISLSTGAKFFMDDDLVWKLVRNETSLQPLW